MRITPNGSQFALDAKALLEHADSIVEGAQGKPTLLAGEPRVGIFSPVASFRPSAIAEPGIQVGVILL
ncbi:hypothetical protein CSX11_32305 [Mycobacterium goodii]|nr:hypothetical protein CSX11_32305 [Mycolicibacterium goodii]